MIENNLRYCREELKMTQRELGIVLGVSPQTLSNWETGYDPITLHRLVRFCNLYNYSLDFVCGITRKNIKYDKIAVLDAKAIGKKLKKLRKILKITQDKFVNKCGIHRTTYNHYETGYSIIKTWQHIQFVRLIKFQWTGLWVRNERQK